MTDSENVFIIPVAEGLDANGDSFVETVFQAASPKTLDIALAEVRKDQPEGVTLRRLSTRKLQLPNPLGWITTILTRFGSEDDPRGSWITTEDIETKSTHRNDPNLG